MTVEKKQREQRATSVLSKSVEGGRLLVHRVENMCGNGTPDNVCINNFGTTIWFEMKDVDVWPKRPATAPLASAFEPGQLPWARAWNFRGGNSLVCARIEGEFYLFNPSTHRIEELGRHELVKAALAIGKENVLQYLYTLQ